MDIICPFFLPRWQKAASYLSASLVEPANLDSCIDHRELWRGGLVIREKKVRKPGSGASELSVLVLHIHFTFVLLWGVGNWWRKHELT